jgi:hypothetical protein
VAMKLLWVILAGACAAIAINAQEVNANAAQTTPPQTTVEAGKETAARLEQQRRADAALLKNPITYSGFAVDVAKSKDKKKLLSLRQPNDPKIDLKHVFYEPQSRGPKGFILFSLDF